MKKRQCTQVVLTIPSLHVNGILGCGMHVPFMKGVLISHAKASKTFFVFAKKKSKTGRLNFFCGILKTNTTLHIHFEVIFLEVLSIYVMQHMPFDESFYPKCPMSPKSTHIFFCMGSHSGKKATKSGSISVTTWKPKSHIFSHLYFIDILVFKTNFLKTIRQTGVQSPAQVFKGAKVQQTTTRALSVF